jgi:hypothetical protein
MAVRIQLRRDTAANWVSNNPVLRAGEFGVETDTLKVKVGNGTSTWNQISNYLNVTPSGLTSELSNYILSSTKGQANGVVALSASSNALIPGNSIIIEGSTDNEFETTLLVTDPTDDRTITFPNASGTVAFTSDIPATTDSLTEGTTNKYFSDELAQDAVAAALAAGTHTNITITYNDTSNAISFAAAPGYTDEEARDTVASMITGATHSGISVAYVDDGANTGSLAFTNTGITSISGTTSEITVTTSSGAAVVSFPNAITIPGSLTLNADPTQALHAATKQYVDNAAEGLLTKPAVDVATTANVTATYANGTLGVGATLTIAATASLDIDGKTSWTQYDSVLFKNQTDPAENGRYVLTTVGDAETAWVFTRCGFCDEADEIPGAYMFVLEGTVNGQTAWVLHVDDPATFTVGTDDIDVYQFSGAGTYVAGNGLTLTGNSFAINTSITADLSTAQTLTNKTLTTPKINEDVALTATATELNVLDGITASTAELNILDGVTSTASELNILDGVTADATELNILDGATLSTTELNYVDGVTSSIQTQLDGKVDESTVTTKGDLIVATTSATVTRIGVGTDGYLLTADSTSAIGLSWLPAPVSLPDQTGNDGKYLTTNGTSASWATLVVPIETGTATVDQNTATTISTTALSAFTSIEYMVSLKQGSKVRTSKVIMQTDGTSVDMTEFAITETGGTMSGVVVSATTSGTDAVLQVTVTDAASSNVTVKFSKVKL